MQTRHRCSESSERWSPGGSQLQDPATKKYTPGPRLIMLARRVASQIDVSALVQPVLDDLRDCFGETVNFATLVGTEVHYLQVAESTRTLRTSPPVGTNDYLHCTALGKAILASLPPSEATEILERVVLDKRTSYTITRRKALLEDLDLTRARGYVFDDEESEIGSRCLAVPVLGPDKHPVAALSISGPKIRLSNDTILEMHRRLEMASETVAMLLGGTHSAFH